MFEKISIYEKFSDEKIDKCVISNKRVTFHVMTKKKLIENFSVSLSEIKEIAADVENRKDNYYQRRIGF